MSEDQRTREERLADPNVPLTEWADRPPALRGEDAADFGRLLLDDDSSYEETIGALRPGRPALAGGREESPIVRFRVPPEVRATLDALVTITHRKQSELLREGLSLLIERYASELGGRAPAGRGDSPAG